MADDHHTAQSSPEIPLKTCTKCHRPFPASLEYFQKHKNKIDGLNYICRECKGEQSHLSYLKNHKAILIRNKEYNEIHKDEVLTRSLAWQKSNPENVKANKQRHVEKIGKGHINALARARRNKNPEPFNEACRRYYEKFPDKRRIKVQIYATRKAGLPYAYTEPQWQVALAYWQFCCAVCEQQADGLFHTIAADHWIPLASPICPGTVATNIIPLCHGLHSCNNQKSKKEPEAWLVEKLGASKAKKKLKDIAAFFLYMETVDG